MRFVRAVNSVLKLWFYLHNQEKKKKREKESFAAYVIWIPLSIISSRIVALSYKPKKYVTFFSFPLQAYISNFAILV